MSRDPLRQAIIEQIAHGRFGRKLSCFLDKIVFEHDGRTHTFLHHNYVIQTHNLVADVKIADVKIRREWVAGRTQTPFKNAAFFEPRSAAFIGADAATHPTDKIGWIIRLSCGNSDEGPGSLSQESTGTGEFETRPYKIHARWDGAKTIGEFF